MVKRSTAGKGFYIYRIVRLKKRRGWRETPGKGRRITLGKLYVLGDKRQRREINR